MAEETDSFIQKSVVVFPKYKHNFQNIVFYVTIKMSYCSK